MSFLTDIQVHVSNATGVSAYPYTIPQGVEYPAIEFSPVSYGRNSDSSLNASNILDRRVQFTVVTKLTKTTIDMAELISELYEGFNGVMGSTTVLISRVNSTVPLYNHQQQTYECAIDVEFVIKT